MHDKTLENIDVLLAFLEGKKARTSEVEGAITWLKQERKDIERFNLGSDINLLKHQAS